MYQCFSFTQLPHGELHGSLSRKPQYFGIVPCSHEVRSRPRQDSVNSVCVSISIYMCCMPDTLASYEGSDAETSDQNTFDFESWDQKLMTFRSSSSSHLHARTTETTETTTPLTISLSLFQISFHFFCVVFPFPSTNPPLALSLLQGPCHPPPNLQSPARCRRDAQRVHPHWPRKGSRGPNHPRAICNSVSFKISRPKNNLSLPKSYLLALQFGRYVFFSLSWFFEPKGWKIWILTEGDFLPTGSWETKKHPKSPHGRLLCQEVKTSWKKNSKGKEQAGNLHGIPRNQ